MQCLPHSGGIIDGGDVNDAGPTAADTASLLAVSFLWSTYRHVRLFQHSLSALMCVAYACCLPAEKYAEPFRCHFVL